MTTLLNDFDQCVLEVITETVGPGYNGVYSQTTTGSYDPNTGVVSTTVVTIPVKVMLLDLTLRSDGFSVKYGTQILAGDKEAYMIPPIKLGGSALVIDPVNDSLTVAGIVYSVESFKELNPMGSDPILYSLYLRR